MFVLIVIVALFGLMWLLLIRPQRRRQTEQRQMLSNLQVGDEIVTAGGIYGRIEDVDESDVTVEIAPGTRVRVARRAVAGIVTEEEDEELEEEPAALEAESVDHQAESADQEAELDSSVADRPG